MERILKQCKECGRHTEDMVKHKTKCPATEKQESSSEEEIMSSGSEYCPSDVISPTSSEDEIERKTSPPKTSSPPPKTSSPPPKISPPVDTVSNFKIQRKLDETPREFPHPKPSKRKRKGGSRVRKPCPECGLLVVHLPMHMKVVHKFSKSVASTITQQYAEALRLRRTCKKQRPYKACPLIGCRERVKRLDHHLVNKHKMEKGTLQYKAALLEGCAKRTQRKKEQVAQKHRPKSTVLQRKQKVLPPILNEFVKFRMSRDGGLISSTNAWQCAVKVQGISECVSGSFVVKHLLDRQRVRNLFLDGQRANEMAPGTLRSYLGALKWFLTFLSMEKSYPDHEIKPQSLAIENWNKSLRKEVGIRQTQIMARDEENRITKDQVAAYQNSKTRRSAIEFLDRKKAEDSMISNCLVRNHLMLTLLLGNWQRSGAIQNLTLQGFNNASRQMDGTDAYYSIVITAHKTAKQGAALLTVTEEVYEQIKTYVDVFRPKFLSEESPEKLFLSTSGKTMSTSLICTGISKIWNPAMTEEKGENRDERITATKIRKSGLTMFRKLFPDKRVELASQMTHRPSTGDKYYQLTHQLENAIEVVPLMAKALSSSILEPNPFPIGPPQLNPFPIGPPLPCTSTASKSEHLPPKPLEEKTLSPPRLSMFKPLAPKPRKTFTREQVEFLRVYYERRLRPNSSNIRAADVDKLKETAFGRSLLDKYTREQLRNRLRLLQGKAKKYA